MKAGKKYMVLFAMILIVFWGISSIEVSAEETVRTGTLGEHNKVEWSYDESTKTLSLSGSDSGLEGSSYYSGGYICETFADVEKIVLKDFAPVGSVMRLFGDLKSLKSVEMKNFDTSKVTNMYGMFAGCNGLTELDLSTLNTKNVTDMRMMFEGCSGLTTLKLVGLDTENVLSMSYMFKGCSALKELDLSGFVSKSTTELNGVFSECSNLEKLNLSNWDTSSVTSMYAMFKACESLKGLELSHFNTSKVADMSMMFYCCKGLESLNLINFNSSNCVNMSNMFCDCSNLKQLMFGKQFTCEKVKNMYGMFSNCRSLTGLKLSSFGVSEVESMNAMFFGCRNLTELDLSYFETPKAISAREMFRECYSLKTLNIQKLNTSNVTDMYHMFYRCAGLTELDLSHFSTSKVIDMGSMFSGCSGLTDLDLSHFNTSQVTDMSNMFSLCSGLKNVNVSGFDTRNVTNMRSMFEGCSSLVALDLSNFYTPKLESMVQMFLSCYELKDLDIHNFDTSNVESLYWTFSGCKKLKVLDMSSFDLSGITNMNSGDMLSGCSELQTIHSPQNIPSEMNVELPGYFVDTNGSGTTAITNVNSEKILKKVRIANENPVRVKIGDSVQLRVKFAETIQDISKNTYFEWQSGAESDVSVSPAGKITGLDTGFDVTITLKSKQGDYIDRITVEVMPTIISQPLSVCIEEGDLATFRVDVKGIGLTYQWQYKNTTDTCWYDSSLSEANTERLYVKGILERNGYQYRCVIKDQRGNTVISNAASLTVKKALEIIEHPMNQKVTEGTDAVFRVSAKGNYLRYQWQYKIPNTGQWLDSGMVGATTNSITVKGTLARNGYQYRCVVKNYYGAEYPSEAAKLTVENAINIIGQPSDKTVTEGEAAEFKIVADGKELTYQWQYKIPTDKYWYDSELDGATTSSLTVKATMNRNDYQYRCIIRDAYGNEYISNVAKLTVKKAIVITSQPADRTVKEDDTVEFKIVASGKDLTYQWQYKNTTDKYWYDSGLEGATTSSLTVKATMNRNGYQYRCVITDAYGNELSSNAGTLTIEEKIKITIQSADQTVEEGTDAVFKVEAEGKNLTYQWQYKNLTDKYWYDSNMEGATTNSLTVPATMNRNGYQYRCVIRDAYGREVKSNAGKLTVEEKIKITIQSTDQTVVEGMDAVFKVEAEGKNLSYQWQYKIPTDKYWYVSNMKGATTNNLTVTGKATRNGYQYRCLVKDGYGKVAYSNASKLNVLMETCFVEQPVDANVTEGSNVTFKVTAKGNDLTYQWQIKSPAKNFWTNSTMTGAKSNSITVSATASRNGYQYRCVIKDTKGKKICSNAATLNVRKVISITEQPTDLTVTAGGNATFKVMAAGNNLTYQWQIMSPTKNFWTNSTMAGAKSNSITVSATEARNGYRYRCVVKDGSGNMVISNAVTLKVAKAIDITTQPSDQTVIEGSNATFKIAASGNTLTYQWQVMSPTKNFWTNSTMEGAKSNSIIVSASTARNGYQYRCVVKDAYGNKVTSNAAKLTVK